MAGKKFGELNAATEAKSDDLYAIRQDRGGGVHETRKLTGEMIFQWIRERLNIATSATANTLARRTAEGRIKAAAPSANDDVTTRGASDARYVRQSNLGKTGGLTVQAAAKVDDADKLGGKDPSYYLDPANTSGGPLAVQYGGTGAGNASGARTNLGINKGFIDGLGVDAATLDGQSRSYYRNASNINAGTLNNARLPAAIALSGATGGVKEAGSVNAKKFYKDGEELILPFGRGWKIFEVNRSANTVYENTTDHPLFLVDSGHAVGIDVQISDDSGVSWHVASRISSTTTGNVTLMIPPGFRYKPTKTRSFIEIRRAS